MRKRTFFVVWGLLVTVACADPTGSTVDATFDQFAAVTEAAGENGGDVRSHVLRHATSAPRLESYELSFWAVRGEESYVEIRYLNGADTNGGSDALLVGEVESVGIDGNTFLWLHMPKNALAYHSDGSEIGWGERVLITISVHPELLFISLQPSGLTFNPQNQPWLYVSYDGADPDYDGDGNVDVVDAYVEDNFLGLWSLTPSNGERSFTPSNELTASGALPDLWRGSGGPKRTDKNKRFSGSVPKFSDVAVSW